MKKIKFYLKKVFKIIIPFSLCLFIVLLSAVPAFATDWKGDGITLDIYSSYFWDKDNGIHRVTPLIDYNSNRSKITFETTNGYAYNESHLYIFCEVKDIQSFYGYFHCQFVGHQQTLYFKPDTGIYTIGYGPNGESTLGDKIINFEPAGDSDISMYTSSIYPLPQKFLIFISYGHAYDFEVEISAIDLSYTQEYPLYDDGRSHFEQMQKEDEFIKEQSLIIDANDGIFDFNNSLTEGIQNGLLALRSMHTQFINRVPLVSNLIKISFALGFNGLVVGLFNGIISGIRNKKSSSSRRKNGGS